MPEVTGTKDLRAYLRMFWRWKWLLLSFVVAVPLIAYVVESGKTNTYQSSALVGVNQATVNSSLVNGAGSFSTTNITAIAELVNTTPVSQLAAGFMRPPGNPSEIAGEVSANGDPTTNFLTITATDRSPERAAEIANAYSKAISTNLQRAAVSQVNASIRQVRGQLATTKSPTTRVTLQNQLQQLIASRSTQGGEAAILQQAIPPSTPTGTSLRRTLELGLLIGLLLGIGAVVVAEGADRRLRAPDDLEDITGLPLLAAIESSAFSGELSTSSEDEEAFQMLRTSLTYFNLEEELQSVIITSAGEKDGKTTVATRLALAAARAGLDVVLIDADLRRAGVTHRLGIHAHDGLGAVIIGSSSLAEVAVELPIEQPGAGRLRVIPAGSPPPNPSALMSAPGMDQTLRLLEKDSDLVIVDSPAALAVSDPLPLMAKVSGVVLVARMNTSTRQTIKRLQKIIETARGKMLGVVATGNIAGPGYKHYYPTYYTNGANGTNGNGHSKKLLGRRHKSPPPVVPIPDRSATGDTPDDQ